MTPRTRSSSPPTPARHDPRGGPRTASHQETHAASHAASHDDAGTEPVIDARGLVCRYGSFEAVRGIDLQVGAGQIVALLGTNGAGKTTTLEALRGERAPDAGAVRVLGADPRRQRRRVAADLGIVFQDAGLPEDLNPRETVTLWQRLQGIAADAGRRTPDALLEQVGLLARAEVAVGALSGGERRRLELALAVAADPRLIIIDEPTTGMDPASRRTTWELVRGLRDEGRSVLLTTHYLEEAEALADHIAIMHHGRIAAAGTLEELVAAHRSTIDVQLACERDARRLLDHARPLGDTTTSPSTPDGRVRLTVATDTPQRDLHRLLDAAADLELELGRLHATPASLDTVFHHLADDTEDPR
ncbi:MAG: ABC transporter ATP-binding protein [Nitriliruptoraceae bacterium]|nr:ABC transporter ATP-binding protein [Nitriliruptoraceae bacterium]